MLEGILLEATEEVLLYQVQGGPTNQIPISLLFDLRGTA